MTSIRNLMTSDIKTVGPDQTARDAASFMLSADTGSIPVCENERVIGIITDRDIAVRGVAAGKGPECSVRELMSKDVVCARQDDDAGQADEQPVFDDPGNPVQFLGEGVWIGNPAK